MSGNFYLRSVSIQVNIEKQVVPFPATAYQVYLTQVDVLFQVAL